MLTVDPTLDAFRKDGFAVAEAILAPDEVAELAGLTANVLAGAKGLEAANEVYDLEPSHTPDDPRVRRIKKPHAVDPVYRKYAEHPRILEIVTSLIGPDVRLNHSKVNVKAPHYGSALEWHQDWAFIPHTNRDLVIVAIMLDDCTPENGPVLMMPGTHEGKLFAHHDGEAFVGAIDVMGEGLDVEKDAVPVLGPAGTASFHHPMTVHGSAVNRSDRSRTLLFYEYAAADAWPLYYGVDYAEFDSRMICGERCYEPRLEPVYVRMPYPVATAGAIYAIQEKLKKKYFGDA